MEVHVYMIVSASYFKIIIMLIKRTHYYKTFCQKNLHVNKMRGVYMKVLNLFGTSFPLISKWQAHDGKNFNRLLKSSGVAPGRCWSFESIGALHELAEVLLHKSDILEIRKLSALEEHRTLMLDNNLLVMVWQRTLNW